MDQSNSATLLHEARDLKSRPEEVCVCAFRCRPVRSRWIINSGSSCVWTPEVEVVYETQQGLKHTHTGRLMGPAPSQPPTPSQHLFLSPVLIPLNSFFSRAPLCTSVLLSHCSPHLCIISAAHGEPGFVWKDTVLSHGATVEAQARALRPLVSAEE